MKKYILMLVASAMSAFAADVSLQWAANPVAEAVTTYVVYEKVNGAWVEKARTPTPSVTITGVTPGVHTYAVAAVNTWGESGKSNEAATPPAASPPTGVRITTIVDVVTIPIPTP